MFLSIGGIKVEIDILEIGLKKTATPFLNVVASVFEGSKSICKWAYIS